MFPSKFRICDVFGIPVYLDISLIVLLVLFVMDFGSFTFGLACALVLAVSITLHELGHALTARVFGYQTRDITLSLLGGCASLIGMPRKASQEFLTALAGPLVSFALAGVGWAAVRFLPIENDWLLGVLVYVFWMNVIRPDLPQRVADLHHAREGDICGDGGGARVRRVARDAWSPLDLHPGAVGFHFASHRLDDLAGRLAGIRDGRPGGPLGKPVGIFRARVAAAV